MKYSVAHYCTFVWQIWVIKKVDTVFQKKGGLRLAHWAYCCRPAVTLQRAARQAVLQMPAGTIPMACFNCLWRSAHHVVYREMVVLI